MSKLKCHHRARPIEWRIPGNPSQLGRVRVSSLAVHAVATTWQHFFNEGRSLHVSSVDSFVTVPVFVEPLQMWVVHLVTCVLGELDLEPGSIEGKGLHK